MREAAVLDELVTTKYRLAWWINACEKAKIFGFDTETTGLQIVSGKDTLVGICLAISPTQGCYIPCGHTTGEPQLDFDLVVDAVAPLLENPKLVKVAHNFAFDYNVTAMLGINVVNYEDTQLMSYALDGQKHRARGHGFDALTKFHFGYDSIRLHDVMLAELGIENFGQVRLAHACVYASEDARMTLALYHRLKKLLWEESGDIARDDVRQVHGDHERIGYVEVTKYTDHRSDLSLVYAEIDRPLARITADMKRRGIGLDMPRVKELHDTWLERMEELQDEIDEAVGHEINLGSPKQIGAYLYDFLECEVLNTTDSGNPSTDDDTLALLEKMYPKVKAIALIREYRELSKLTGSFTGSWLEKVGKDERLHGDFILTNTNTRRLASSDPNLQNIPT